ncbi:hypothetical protein H5410_020886, partial [Solanum commersonii]
PRKRLHLKILDFDTVALKFGLDSFPTQFDPLNKNTKSNFRNDARILRYMEITIYRYLKFEAKHGHYQAKRSKSS